MWREDAVEGRVVERYDERGKEKYEAFIRSGTIKRRGLITRPLSPHVRGTFKRARSVLQPLRQILSYPFHERRIEKERARCGPLPRRNPKSMTRLGRFSPERAERGREKCSTWLPSGATSRMSPSNGVCGVHRLSDNKRRPEATDNTRFHKFFRTRRFIHCKFRRWATKYRPSGRPSGAKEFTSDRYGFSIADTARKKHAKRLCVNWL